MLKNILIVNNKKADYLQREQNVLILQTANNLVDLFLSFFFSLVTFFYSLLELKCVIFNVFLCSLYKDTLEILSNLYVFNLQISLICDEKIKYLFLTTHAFYNLF